VNAEAGCLEVAEEEVRKKRRGSGFHWTDMKNRCSEPTSLPYLAYLRSFYHWIFSWEKTWMMYARNLLNCESRFHLHTAIVEHLLFAPMAWMCRMTHQDPDGVTSSWYHLCFFSAVEAVEDRPWTSLKKMPMDATQ